MQKLYNNLFDFCISNNNKFSISRNEIYNQFILYSFFSMPGDLVILTPNINDANKVYNDIRNYIENVYIFPEDDYLTKRAVASSPELLYMRMKLLNNLRKDDKKIVVCHLNSYLKKLDNPLNFENKRIKLSKNKKIERNKLEERLQEIGYKKESLVTNTGEYAVRGFVIDIFPIDEDKPYRIEFFDNEIELIKTFDENTQLSLKEVNDLTINPTIDDFKDSNSSILDYLNNPLLLIQDNNQLVNAENNLNEQRKYYEEPLNDMFKLSDIKSKNTIYVDLIDNNGSYDKIIQAIEIKNYNEDIKSFIEDLKKSKQSFFYSNNKSFKSLFAKNNVSIEVVNESLNRGFIYNGVSYFSDNDLKKEKRSGSFNNNYKLGKRVNSLDKLNIGDYVVHRASGIGVYMGITTITKNALKRDYILIKYKGNDKLYLPVEDVSKLYKYSSKEGAKPVIHRLNSNEWKKTKSRIKEKIKELTEELLKIYKNRNIAVVEPFEKDNDIQRMFEKEFNYEETQDQLRAIEEIKRDLEGTKPMDRLLCGDVGYGKTEVIFRAMFKAVLNDKQVMYLCPTTLLSHQQYMSAKERFEKYGVNVAILNRHSTTKEVKYIIEGLASQKIDIVFGTHRLLSKDVKFKNLGLLIIDEEHRFGVVHKEQIKKIKNNVHVLSVSATPIPRSLQMSLTGIRDLSLIETAPKNRYPVQTYVINYDEAIIREVVLREKSRNGQVFILYNKIEDIDKLTNKFRELLPEVSIKYAHGQMNKNQIQDIMFDFTEGKFDVLVTTTIVENGIDIPNANTLIIVDSDRFGLSQLYQIRGRVGRSDRIAYAYLMYKKERVLTEQAKKRLDAIKEFTDLGSGYKISMRDLSIRGAGDLLGSEQAGFIDSVGVDLYLQLVNEEVNNIEEDEESVKILDTVETHIDREYIKEDEIIIDLYKKIDEVNSEESLKNLLDEINDRFGKIDDNLLIYIYQEYLEKILKELNISIFENDNFKISIKLKEEIYSKLNIEDLFINASKITTKFNFVYKNKMIIIRLTKNNLEKHYIEYLLELIKYIKKQSK